VLDSLTPNIRHKILYDIFRGDKMKKTEVRTAENFVTGKILHLDAVNDFI